MKKEYDLSKLDLKLNVSKMPSEESILKIIDFVKQIEMQSRMESEKEFFSHYTRFACFDLAKIIKNVYPASDVSVINLNATLCLAMFRPITQHYVVGFDGFVYDINGKHTLEEVIEFCKKEFDWLGGKCEELSNEELEKMKTPETGTDKNDIITYCIKMISAEGSNEQNKD